MTGGAVEPGRDAALQALVEREIDRDNGRTAVTVRNIRTGATAAYREDEVFPSASVAKLLILVEVYRRLDAGLLALDRTVTITADDITGGAGVLQAREGERITIGELLNLSVTVSDNVAARILLRVAGGVTAVNQTMAGFDLPQTRLYADDRPNTTTAAETAWLLAYLAERSPAPDARPAATNIPPTLPALLAFPQAQAWLTQGIPTNVAVAHKSGQLPGVRHDAGIVYGPRGPYVIVALTDDLADQGDAETFITTLARDVYNYFSRG